MNPFLSVIIPAHNEENYLGKTLECLKGQTYKDFEVIVIANHCSDRTEEVAKGRCHRLISVEEAGLSKARNLGANKAKGDLLIFLDADTCLETDALQIIARQFHPEYAVGTLRAKPDKKHPLYCFMYFYKNRMHKYRLHAGSSGVIICWRQHFKKVGGFNPKLHMMENSEIIQRMRHYGKYKFIGSTVATTSMRRYERQGVLYNFWFWLKIWLLSHFSNLHNRPYRTVR